MLMMACVDPLNVKLTNTEKRLVVDGLITDQPGPYQVKLFYYSNEFSPVTRSQFIPVTSARLSVTDDRQKAFYLTEISPGIYETNEDEFTGEIGREYFLSITTAEGVAYQSNVQSMTAPGEISNLYFEFEAQPKPQYDDALKVYIDSKGELEKDNLFRWRWTTIYKTKTNPELYVEDTPGGGTRPAPLPCSGYIYRGGRLVPVGECSCCFCWSYNYSEGAYVSKNEFVSESQFNKQYLGLIPVTSMHFYDRYYIEVQQLSVTDEAYHFWSLVEKQQKGATDIFQPNAIKIRGNIKGITNPDEEVLGFFGASAVALKSMYIDKSIIPYELPPIDPIHDSCVEYFKNATTEKPFFW